MSTTRPLSFAPVATPRTAGAFSTTRRERDFGVGYGRSSGYAAPRRYTANATLPQFRFA